MERASKRIKDVMDELDEMENARPSKRLKRENADKKAHEAAMPDEMEDEKDEEAHKTAMPDEKAQKAAVEDEMEDAKEKEAAAESEMEDEKAQKAAVEDEMEDAKEKDEMEEKAVRTDKTDEEAAAVQFYQESLRRSQDYESFEQALKMDNGRLPDVLAYALDEDLRTHRHLWPNARNRWATWAAVLPLVPSNSIRGVWRGIKKRFGKAWTPLIVPYAMHGKKMFRMGLADVEKEQGPGILELRVLFEQSRASTEIYHAIEDILSAALGNCVLDFSEQEPALLLRVKDTLDPAIWRRQVETLQGGDVREWRFRLGILKALQLFKRWQDDLSLLDDELTARVTGKVAHIYANGAFLLNKTRLCRRANEVEGDEDFEDLLFNSREGLKFTEEEPEWHAKSSSDLDFFISQKGVRDFENILNRGCTLQARGALWTQTVWPDILAEFPAIPVDIFDLITSYALPVFAPSPIDPEDFLPFWTCLDILLN